MRVSAEQVVSQNWNKMQTVSQPLSSRCILLPQKSDARARSGQLGGASWPRILIRNSLRKK